MSKCKKLAFNTLKYNLNYFKISNYEFQMARVLLIALVVVAVAYMAVDVLVSEFLFVYNEVWVWIWFNYLYRLFLRDYRRGLCICYGKYGLLVNVYNDR